MEEVESKKKEREVVIIYYPPASEAGGEFRVFIRLAGFSGYPSVCDTFCCFLLTLLSIWVRGVNFEILLLPEFLC